MQICTSVDENQVARSELKPDLTLPEPCALICVLTDDDGRRTKLKFVKQTHKLTDFSQARNYDWRLYSTRIALWL